MSGAALALAVALAGGFGVTLPAWAQARSAKVAGDFYPGDRAELLDLVTELLKRQPEPVITAPPRILIVPHAGYQYSGLVAASGFRHLEGHAYRGVVVVGFTHREQFSGSSVDTREAYETPLGEIPVDQEAVAVLRAYPGITHVEEAHASDEHSLEVELPFLQVALGRFRLVPVLMGNVSLQEAQRLADALAGLAKMGDYLFVFSSDLSHYHPHDEAQQIDERTVAAILQETPQAVTRLFDRGELEACGRGPILTSLLLAGKLGYLKRQLLYAANSGDTFGNPSSVVGYAAIGLFDRRAVRADRMSPEAGQALVAAARQSLEGALAHRTTAHPEPLSRYPELAKAHGLFVTLRTKTGALRGCIGRIETSEPLMTSVGPVALDAALHDTRFAPVTGEELPRLHIEVSVLTSPLKLEKLDELVPGRDGVILEHEGHHGVFLPQVWEETGWTREEFLRELASQKAGLPPDAWQQATLYVFQDQAFEEPLPEGLTAH